MPDRSAFESHAAWWSTFAHELTHWTAPRVGRDGSFKAWGDESYAAEELVAEMGAAMLAAVHDVESVPREDHAQYLAGWARRLSTDDGAAALWQAASAAQKAADYLNGLADGGQP
jgi:antirestriction protein ArdC